MNSILHEEGNLQFLFPGYSKAVKFDNYKTNPHGLLPVDFIAENDDCICFIEVKDYQNPHPKAVNRREEERQKLLNTTTDSLYCHKIGSKFKDSILRKYVAGDIGKNFMKRIIYLFYINFDALGERERGMLKERISNHIPASRSGLFPNMIFDLVNAEQLESYGIICFAKQ